MILHLCDRIRTYHLLRRIQQWHMNRDVIALPVDLIHFIDMVNLSGKVPCSVDRNIRIVSVDIHSKMDGGICHLYADRSQPDNAKLFALQLTSRKLFLFFFRRRSHIRISVLALRPVRSADDITGCQQHPCKYQLLYAIGIRPRRIEYDNSMLCTFIQRNIVDSCSRAGDGTEPFRQLQLMHFCTSHEHGIRIRKCLRLFIDIIKTV